MYSQCHEIEVVSAQAEQEGFIPSTKAPATLNEGYIPSSESPLPQSLGCVRPRDRVVSCHCINNREQEADVVIFLEHTA